MFDEASKTLRWFLLPSEAAHCLQGNQSQNAANLPFYPPSLREQLGLPAFSDQHKEEEISAKDMLDSNIKTERISGGPIPNVIIDKDDYIGKSDVIKTNINHSVDTDDTGEKTFSEGMQKCLDNGFNDSSTVDKTCGDLSESKSVGDTHDKNESVPVKVTGVCNITPTSVKSVELSSDSQKKSDKCETNLCENVSLCRKRPAESEGTSPACAVSMKRTKDDMDGKVVVVEVDGKDKKHIGRKSKTKKEGTRWFSPPKTIFTPFLKVPCFLHFLYILSRFLSWKKPAVLYSEVNITKYNYFLIYFHEKCLHLLN